MRGVATIFLPPPPNHKNALPTGGAFICASWKDWREEQKGDRATFPDFSQSKRYILISKWPSAYRKGIHRLPVKMRQARKVTRSSQVFTGRLPNIRPPQIFAIHRFSQVGGENSTLIANFAQHGRLQKVPCFQGSNAGFGRLLGHLPS
jgi:hypothetical protein